MSNDFSANPYSANISTSSNESVNELSESLLTLARWQRVFAILLYIGAGLTMLAVIAQLGSAILLSGSPAAMGAAVFATAIILVFTYIFYWAPAQRLNRAASTAKASALSSDISMVEIIKTQQAFWQYVGRLFVGIIITYGIAILVGITMLLIAMPNR